MQTKHALSAMTGLALAASGSAIAADASKLKWDGVPKTEITLFYPGLLAGDQGGGGAAGQSGAALKRGAVQGAATRRTPLLVSVFRDSA